MCVVNLIQVRPTAVFCQEVACTTNQSLEKGDGPGQLLTSQLGKGLTFGYPN